MMFETEWRRVIRGPVETRLFEALEDPNWEWRTISALSRATGLGPEDTCRILRKYPALVRQSVMPGPSGEELYTLQRRYFERQSIIQKIWTSVSSSSSST